MDLNYKFILICAMLATLGPPAPNSAGASRFPHSNSRFLWLASLAHPQPLRPWPHGDNDGNDNNDNDNNGQNTPTTTASPGTDPTRNQSYSGLFYTPAQIDQLTNQRSIDQLYVVRTVKASYPFKSICRKSSSDSSSSSSISQLTASVPLPACNIQPDCTCETTHSLDVFSQVQATTGGPLLTVAHEAFGSQLVHVGTCANAGETCGRQHQCRQSKRLHQLLVFSPSPQLTFVPVEVNHHCDCIAAPGA